MKSVFVLIGALVFLIFSQGARGAQFSTGNELSAVTLQGTVTVWCSDPWSGSSSGYFSCALDILDPAENARVIAEKGLGADRIVVTATQENGRIRTKESGYDSAKGQSEKHFNLWIHTVTQRPLLGMGQNSVEYKLFKGEELVKTGGFTATVRDGGGRTCRHDWISSSDPQDCRSSFMVCSRYFAQNNYCE